MAPSGRDPVAGVAATAHGDPDAPHVKNALGYGGPLETLAIAAMLVLASAPIVVPAIHGSWHTRNLALACALLIAGLAGFTILSRRRAARARAWLAALPFPFDLPRYWKLLAAESASRSVTIELELAQPVADPANFVAWLRDHAWIADAGVDGARFWLTGKPLTTQVGSNYTTGPVHRWFRDVAAPFLAKLHADTPLVDAAVR